MKLSLFMPVLMVVVIAAAVVLALTLTTRDAGANDHNHGECGGGVSIIGNNDLVEYDAGADIVTGLCIKSGKQMWGGEHSSFIANDGVIMSTDGKQKCYLVEGIVTSVVTVKRLGRGNQCQGISHIDVVTMPKPEHCEMNDNMQEEESCPTPTSTATPTPTSTPTPQPTVTPTPTTTPPAGTTPTPTGTEQTNHTPTSETPLGFPSTGGEGSDGGSCRDWTTGQAGDVVQPCPDGGASIWWIVLISLLAGAGVAALATVALYWIIGKTIPRL